MKITLLGHATYLIETCDLKILTDPVLDDAYLDDLAWSCPRRVINADQIPPIDVLYLSHNHSDHFQVRSLAALRDRVKTVLCANDPTIQYVFKELGYTDVRPISDWQRFEFGKTQLLVTPSRWPVPEHGLLISDPSGRAWNQVDSLVLPKWLDRIDQPIHVHLANFSPTLIHEMSTNESTAFPVEVYDEMMEIVRDVNAKLVIPSASGFALKGPFAWHNKYSFPVSHERFVRDVRRLDNGSQAEVLYPGDVVELTDGNPRILREAGASISRTVDRSMAEQTFDPSLGLPYLTEDNSRQIAEPDLRASVASVLKDVAASLADPVIRGSASLRRLSKWEVKMRIRVLFPSGPTDWTIDFAAPDVRLTPGSTDEANYMLTVKSSGLHDVVTGHNKDQFFIDGYRSFDLVYRVHEERVRGPGRGVQSRLSTEQTDLPRPMQVFEELWKPSYDAYFKARLAEVRR